MIDSLPDLILISRSEWTLASRNSPAYHVHTDFTYEAAVKRVGTLLGITCSKINSLR